MIEGTPIGDHFDHIVQGEAQRSSPGQRPGGEWDAWFHLPRRKRRVLIGAGFARRRGMWPDDLADHIARNHPNLAEPALDWYYRTAFQVLRERRRDRHRIRHLRIANQTGHATYYQRRAALAVEAGYRTFWQFRKQRWGQQVDADKEAA